MNGVDHNGSPSAPDSSPNHYECYHYCVSLLDLLDQRMEYRSQGLIPLAEEDRKAFRQVVENTVGRIDRLQRRAKSLLSHTPGLTPAIRTMGFGDSILQYVSLRDEAVHCLAVYEMIIQSALLCFVGLAEGVPIRGAVDIAWAVELAPGQLHGAAPVKTYEYESEVAQYPRIIVSPRTVQYLEAHAGDQANDPLSIQQREWAKRSLEVVKVDHDGFPFADYLGGVFPEQPDAERITKLYVPALAYVKGQLEKYQEQDDLKMSGRYWRLLQYFESYRDKWTVRA